MNNDVSATASVRATHRILAKLLTQAVRSMLVSLGADNIHQPSAKNPWTQAPFIILGLDHEETE